MSVNKRFYWLKLPKNFFDRNDIKVIESQKKGSQYIVFYLKLLTQSIEYSGDLRFNEKIPYNDEMLSTVTNTDIDTVRQAMKLFENLDLLVIDQNQTIHMVETQKMLGSETASTIRSRKSRAKANAKIGHEKSKTLQCNNNATNCNTEIDIELDKELELEGEYINTNMVKTHKELEKSEKNEITLPLLKKIYEDHSFSKFNVEMFFYHFEALNWKFNNGNQIPVTAIPAIMNKWELTEWEGKGQNQSIRNGKTEMDEPAWLQEYLDEISEMEGVNK